MANTHNVAFNSPVYGGSPSEAVQTICPCGTTTAGGQRRCSACLGQDVELQSCLRSPSSMSQLAASPYQASPNSSRALESPSGPFPLPLRSRHPFTANDSEAPYGAMVTAPQFSSGRNSSVGSFSRSTSSLFSDLDSDSSRRASSATADVSAIRTPSVSSSPGARQLQNEYAPMAAGFARLKARDTKKMDSTTRGRTRPTSDLGAKMFEGAA